ncbi:MAG: YbaB/EbfC family nucleoid-associated protein [Candidatus Firestonebacteria bacterium]|nr:YbaB/EbfC family nucleoid-associated protein [Candidatus Firestonebacteria bacterium]
MGKHGMDGMLKKVQQMQFEMNKIQKELENKVIEVSTGGGMVNISINGKQEVLKIKIEKEVVKSDDIEMLEDLILSGVNEAIRASLKMVENEMRGISSGLNIPGLI